MILTVFKHYIASVSDLEGVRDRSNEMIRMNWEKSQCWLRFPNGICVNDYPM